jgi:3-hydroxyisobutyrate dehydrogenase-like beta-hydroxyacid dehydrogenase
VLGKERAVAERIGLIGLGNVGSGFAKRLREAECSLTVLDLDEAKVARATALGATAAATPAEVAAAADTVLLSLPGSHAVEAVMDGPEGVLTALRSGHLIADTGTSHPDTDIYYHRRCRERGAAFIDAPITGRSQGWIMMAGGSAEEFARAREVLGRLAYKLQHIGPVGSGQLLKLTNQMILAGQWGVWAEAVTFAQQAGLDPRLLKDVLEFPVPEQMYGDNFHAGGHLALHYKDLGYLLEVAHRVEANLPLASLMHEAFKAAKVAGEPDWGQTGVITYWRKLNGGGSGIGTEREGEA